MSKIIKANPGIYYLSMDFEDGSPIVNRTPIIAWELVSGRDPEPIRLTDNFSEFDDNYHAIEFPDGLVWCVVSHYEHDNIAEWIESCR
jgi:hypothetical protein